ncbi:type 1 glutamine amidotransferase domain-containing protein [Aquamicrobium sp. LC103]|uniref:type 1 glutamine amidotransferase domain-containing protein n=1 Tax=Aquamicrobium sp. LC103 TaxID=1120658 RepID=UPI00063EB63C|nr:type 1 glutamine amidotransferase domain-containing protein [Aquamicrobium sp. LC103]TKT74875.1 type 1 glutamine amidotransferase [Aquamicrobium sp. LC103]
MPAIDRSRIMILATNGFEQSELEVPLQKLRQAGAQVEIVSPKEGEIVGWEKKDWGSAVKVDRTVGDAEVSDYDALVLPGGQINPDLLRVDKPAVDFIRSFQATGKPVAAICHAPWLLIEAGLVEGRRATSYHSIRTDMENAGAKWEDSETVRDGNIITSRKPADLEAFVAAIVEAVEGDRARRSAAE